MRRISTLGYSMKQGMKSIVHNRMYTAASIGTMTACLFLFGILYFVVANFRYLMKEAETTVGITVFFDKGITEEEIAAIGEEITVREDVDRLVYLSADEAWEQYKEEKLAPGLAATFGNDNPLENSASFAVYLKAVEKQAEVVAYIEALDGVRQVNDSQSFADMLSGFNRLVGYISAAIIIILLGVAAFLISTTVSTGISVRKEEIGIMQLIGAADAFIKGPFIVEGVVIGLAGAVLPLAVLYAIYHRVIAFITDRFDNIFSRMEFLDIHTVFQTLIPVSLIIGVGIGFIGSYLTVRRHLRKGLIGD